MEKGPKLKIVGKASSDKKELVRQKIEGLLVSHFDNLPLDTQERLRKLEYPKSEKESTIIEYVNKETNKLMQECGMEPYNIPIENYHIVPSELYKSQFTRTGTAATFHKKQAMVFDAETHHNNPVSFGLASIHETLHLKAYTVFELGEKEESDESLYRTGVSSYATIKDGTDHVHLDGLHEAIVATQEKKMFAGLMQIQGMKEEREWLTTNEARELKKKIAENDGLPENEILWVYRGDEKNWEGAYYYRQRLVLDYICHEIQNQFPERFKNTNEVFKEFLKAHFTGHLLTIANLIDGTFGKGSFRLLGNMGTDRNSGIVHLESFKRIRDKFLKDNI